MSYEDLIVFFMAVTAFSTVLLVGGVIIRAHEVYTKRREEKRVADRNAKLFGGRFRTKP